jgi:hypothetical protein
VSLSLQSLDGSYISDSGFSDDQGSFSFEGLPSGQYLLKASLNREGYFSLQRQVVIKDLSPNKISLELLSHPLIAGRAYIRDRTGVAIFPSLKFQLERAGVGGTIVFLTDKNGAFSQRSGDEGYFWWVFPELQPEHFVEKILVDGKDVTYQPMKLERAPDLLEISVEISVGAATIRGSTQNGACHRYLVYAVALDSKSDEIRSVKKANCSADSFAIPSLAPGRYYVVGIPGTDALKASAPNVRTKHQGVDDKQYDVIGQIVKTLKMRGTKALTLDRAEIYDNAQPLVLDK